MDGRMDGRTEECSCWYSHHYWFPCDTTCAKLSIWPEKEIDFYFWQSSITWYFNHASLAHPNSYLFLIQDTWRLLLCTSIHALSFRLLTRMQACHPVFHVTMKEHFLFIDRITRSRNKISRTMSDYLLMAMKVVLLVIFGCGGGRWKCIACYRVIRSSQVNKQDQKASIFPCFTILWHPYFMSIHTCHLDA